MPGLPDGRRPLATAWASGAFRFWFVGEHWEWSDELARMHGYEPGTVEPTTELLLSHKHPDDRAPRPGPARPGVACPRARFPAVTASSTPAGNVHDAMVVADRMSDETGAVVGTAGYYLDLTATFVETRQVALDEALPDLFEARAVIEQAKGHSDGRLPGQRRAGLRRAAVAVAGDQHQAAFAGASNSSPKSPRCQPPSADVQSAFDHLLLTVHQRIPGESTA